MFDRLKALMLLSECTGRDIWPVELCRDKGVPESWIEDLADSYESGFNSPLQTIYVDDRVTNQFFGVQDLHLARKLGEYLGVNTHEISAIVLGRSAEVRDSGGRGGAVSPRPRPRTIWRAKLHFALIDARRQSR